MGGGQSSDGSVAILRDLFITPEVFKERILRRLHAHFSTSKWLSTRFTLQLVIECLGHICYVLDLLDRFFL